MGGKLETRFHSDTSHFRPCTWAVVTRTANLQLRWWRYCKATTTRTWSVNVL